MSRYGFWLLHWIYNRLEVGLIRSGGVYVIDHRLSQPVVESPPVEPGQHALESKAERDRGQPEAGPGGPSR